MPRVAVPDEPSVRFGAARVDEPKRSRARLLLLLSSPRVALVAAGIAVVLNLSSVGTGWHIDDLYHRAQFLEIGPLFDSSNMTNRMFDFLSGDPEQIRTFKELGVLPWWAADDLKLSFWRPLSSFTHVIDYTLWPDSGPLMHLYSLAWLGLLVFVTALWYRRTIAIPYVPAWQPCSTRSTMRTAYPRVFSRTAMPSSPRRWAC